MPEVELIPFAGRWLNKSDTAMSYHSNNIIGGVLKGFSWNLP